MAVTARRDRVVLATLLVNAGSPVSYTTLIEAVWGADPPATASNQLHSCVSRLRRVLAPAGAQIITRAQGYLIRVVPDDLDSLVFTQLVRQARRARAERRWEQAAGHYRRALQLWRDQALAGLFGDILRDAGALLDEQRLSALEERLDLEIALGQAAELVAEVAGVARRYPHRERLQGALMRALYLDGRQSEALEVYRGLHRRLRDELGVEPSPTLAALHQRILRGEEQRPDLPTPATPGPAPPDRVIPQELPADVPGFTGRAAELAELDRLLPDNAPVTPALLVVSAIGGMAGVGKTAVAIHAGHRIAGKFPDGQLFVDLHGYTEGMKASEAGEVLDRVLRTLGVSGEQIPSDLDERAALYRSRLAQRRMLIVLDNAATEEQITPLLPGSPGCLVVVTSRRRLTGLDATHAMSLDILPPDDAVTLFTRTVGVDRLAQEPSELVAEVVELCGRLPLAIRIAAARLRSHPAWRLADLVERLRDQRQRLAELESGQRSVAAALGLSYRELDPDLRRFYRLLGLHPGPDIEPYAAAALADTSTEDAGRLLERLHDAHLLHEPIPGRYVFHDMVRAHAGHIATGAEPEQERRASLTRLLDHYRHTASMAMDTIHPYERDRRPTAPPVTTPTPDVSDETKANGWLDSELPNLLSTAPVAQGHRWPGHTCHLSTILHRHLLLRGLFRDADTLHHQALVAAHSTGDCAGELAALLRLSWIHQRRGRYEDASDGFSQVLEIARNIGHRVGERDALLGLAFSQLLQGRHEPAIDYLGQTLETARAAGDPFAELEALAGFGRHHLLRGRSERATEVFGTVLEIASTIRHRHAELNALRALGWIHRRHARYDHATDCFERALEIACTAGYRTAEMNALTDLGHLRRLQGRYRHAAECLGRALEIARATGHRIGEFNAMIGLGWAHRLAGEHGQAADLYWQVFDLAQASDRNWELEAVYGLGRLAHATGDLGSALDHHRRALELAVELRQPADQARARDGLAHAYHALHQHQPARHHWQRALSIIASLGTDHTGDEETSIPAIRAHLAILAQQQAAGASPDR